jgi:hypothetical protein
MQSPSNTQAVKAALGIIKTVAELIQALGQVPSGELYARLMGHMDIDTYQSIIKTLKNCDLVKDAGMHMLVWVGPEAGKEANRGN